MGMCKIYTLKKLIKTGLPIFDSCRYADTEVGEKYLQSSVISMWDFGDYSEYYTYYEGVGDKMIKSIVDIYMGIGDKMTWREHLKKDLSNIETFQPTPTINDKEEKK